MKKNSVRNKVFCAPHHITLHHRVVQQLHGSRTVIDVTYFVTPKIEVGAARYERC